MKPKIKKSDEEWKKELTTDQFKVLRKKGTEPAFTGQYWDNHKEGTYNCAGCGKPLFLSKDKFDSGCGWPSYTMPISKENISTEDDFKFGMHRTEVLCSNCGGHLGHVFDDGPKPTGLRYCINSISLDFEPKN